MGNKNLAHLQSAFQKWLWRITGMSLLLLSAYGWLRFIAAISKIKPLLNFGLDPNLPGYLQISGVLIGSFSLASWLLLKFNHPAANKTTFVVTVTFVIVFWIERLFIWKNPLGFENLLLMLALSIIWIIILWLGLCYHKNCKATL